MKITLEIRTENNLRLPFSAEVKSLADLAKLGRVLVSTPRKISRLLPGLKDAKITGVKLATR